MIILIPLGGIGNRFKIDGYDTPKALIRVNNKPILFHLLDNLILENRDINFVYIPYNKEYIEYNLEALIMERYPTVVFHFFQLANNTRGAVETINLSLNNLLDKQIIKTDNEMPLLCIDGDNYYKCDIIAEWKGENVIFTFNDTSIEARYSYVEITDNAVKQIIEKEKISDNACCGAYGFKSIADFIRYSDYIINNNIRNKDEFFVSTLISEMLKDGKLFRCANICNKDYYSLGTPSQIKVHANTILFDLDGTLVNTDEIYIKVWQKIFNKYGMQYTVDSDFFTYFIKGKNDATFLKYLISNISDSDIINISRLKDKYFIAEIQHLGRVLLLPGAIDFIEQNKNSKMAIVTSSNKSAAEQIMKITCLDEYISLLISSEDCVQHKPSPEPYLRAIDKLNASDDKIYIFEDSYSGYISAKNVGKANIILLSNENSCDDIAKLTEFKIPNYLNFSLDQFPIKKSALNSDITSLIKSTLNYMPITNIEINHKSIKTGYICDINSYVMHFPNNKSENLILKINNTNNELSKTAEMLNLYYNEEYFYQHISSHINVNVPKYYGMVNISDTRRGIMLSDLTTQKGVFNINLNNNIVELLSLVREASNMHSKYWFNNKTDIPSNMITVPIVNKIAHYSTLVNNRYSMFLKKNETILNDFEKKILNTCFANFANNVERASEFPLNFCHGDFKSANVYYANNMSPYILDWQYIQLNKGISDIVFLLIESIDYDERLVMTILNYYYYLITQTGIQYDYESMMNDFNLNLQIFPFVVCVWFNSEDSDKLLDKVFPVKFMRNMLKYYNRFLKA